MSKNNCMISDGLQVLFAEVPLSTSNALLGHHKQYQSFVIPPIDEAIAQTKQDIVTNLYPGAKLLAYKNQTQKDLFYDIYFFQTIGIADDFLLIRDTIIKQNTADEAQKFMKNILGSTSQTALKAVLARNKLAVLEKHQGFNLFFAQYFNWEQVFLKKLKECHADKGYQRLCKQFPSLPYCIEQIIFHTALHVNEIEFSLLGTTIYSTN